MKPNTDLCKLLPWYVNGTLDEQQMHTMDAHIEACDDCASDFRTSMEISRAMQSSPQGVEELQAHQQFGFAQLQRKISQSQSESTQSRLMSGRLMQGISRFFENLWHNYQWVFSASAGAALALTVVLVLPGLGTSTNQEGFVLLSSENETTHPAIQVIFSEGTSEKQLRDFMVEHQLEFIGSPSSAGVYRLQLNSDESAEQQLADVTAFPQVHWASLE